MLTALFKSAGRSGAAAERVGISIFGDSHAERFAVGPQMIDCCPALAKVSVNLKAFRGATILGFGRRGSKLGVRSAIEEKIRPDDRALVFNFGQVDVELGYYYRLVVKKEKLAFEDFADTLVASYVETVRGFAADGRVLIVKGINKTVLAYNRAKAIQYTGRIITENITDPDEAKRHVPRLREVFPDYRVRNRRHDLFNRRLATACAAAGLLYYDCNGSFDDPLTGRIRPEFIPETFDHHVPATLAVHLAYWRPLLGLLDLD